MKLCDMLTGYRLRKRLTRAELAKRSGLSASYLRTLEKEAGHGGKKTKPTYTSIEKLASAMGVTAKDLIRELDVDERNYFNLPYEELSILARAEHELPGEKRELLEKIAMEFLLNAANERTIVRTPVFTEIEEGLLSARGVRHLSEVYAKSLNVFTDASFYNSPGEENSDRFTAAVVVTENSELVSGTVYAGRTGIGPKGAEEFAVWLGFLEALKYRRADQPVNIFTDHSAFSLMMEFLTAHSKAGDPQREVPGNKTFKGYGYGIATRLAAKAVEKNVRFHLWAVKAHLNPRIAASLQKQIEYFNRQNQCELTTDLAKDICTYNGLADLKSRGYRKKLSEKKSARWTRLPKETFTPLTLSDEEWIRFHHLFLLGQMNEEPLPFLTPASGNETTLPEKEEIPKEISETVPAPETPEIVSAKSIPEIVPEEKISERSPEPESSEMVPTENLPETAPDGKISETAPAPDIFESAASKSGE